MGQSIGKRNKQRGYELEREVVLRSEERGLKAQRMWGSDGRSFNLPKEVDVLIETPIGDVHVQCKRKKKLATYILPSKDVHIQVVKGDHQGTYAVLPLDLFLSLLTRTNE